MTLAFETSRGRCVLIYDAEGVHAVRVDTRLAADRGPHPAKMRRLAADLTRAIHGARVDFTKVKLALGRVPTFHAAVYTALVKIPWGVTLSYGELAARAGRPGAARAVGQAMARCPWSVIVPCHRVIKSDGSLGGYGGPAGARLKRALLDAELESFAAEPRPRPIVLRKRTR
jgi:methylated-DNA-[protein]-cysteine S-methyltransferase